MMNLGTQTGSLVNHLMSRSAPQEPQVGMPATLLSWSDRDPATVIEVFVKGKTTYFTVQSDAWKALKPVGLSEDQDYEYFRDPDGTTYTFRQSRQGGWEGVRLNPETGRYLKGGANIMLGRREKYVDPTF